jgi:hypothetical protein
MTKKLRQVGKFNSLKNDTHENELKYFGVSHIHWQLEIEAKTTVFFNKIELVFT